jgi:hypothetical protein
LNPFRSNLIENFLKFEADNDLFNLIIADIAIWHPIRFNVYNKILSRNLNIGQAHTSLENESIFKRAILKVKQLPDILTKSPYLYLDKKDVLILNHHRRVMDGAYYTCLYTDIVRENLKLSNIVLEEPILDQHYKPIKNKNIIYTDYINLISTINSRLFKNKYISNDDINSVKEVIDLINNEFKTNFELNNLGIDIIKTIINYKLMYPYYERIVKKIQPKLIVEVVSYGLIRYIINDIAAKNNIPTVELQHGTMGRNHIAYNFSEKRDISTFPDYIFLFGKFWQETSRLPIDDSRTKIVGWPYFEQKVNHYKTKEGMKNGKKAILFISQGTIGEELSKIAIEVSNMLNKKYRIIYKLHPGEYARWKKEYPWLIGADVEVIDNNNHDIHYYFAQADIQVGVYSTAIFEGLGYGLKTIIWKLYGYGHMQELYCKGYADLVDNVDEFMMILNSIENLKEEHDISCFWKQNSLNNIIKELDAIMKKDK